MEIDWRATNGLDHYSLWTGQPGADIRRWRGANIRGEEQAKINVRVLVDAEIRQIAQHLALVRIQIPHESFVIQLRVALRAIHAAKLSQLVHDDLAAARRQALPSGQKGFAHLALVEGNCYRSAADRAEPGACSGGRLSGFEPLADQGLLVGGQAAEAFVIFQELVPFGGTHLLVDSSTRVATGGCSRRRLRPRTDCRRRTNRLRRGNDPAALGRKSDSLTAAGVQACDAQERRSHNADVHESPKHACFFPPFLYLRSRLRRFQVHGRLRG